MKQLLFILTGLCLFQNICAQTTGKVEATDSLEVADMYAGLPEVMVKGELSVAKLENGALTFDMPRLLQQLPADNAYEALGRIPGMNESDGRICFGAQPVTLVINGKPTTLDAAQVAERLKQMPADRLAKAKVMMAAPAKYHVRGMVINVVTKDHAGEHHTSGQLEGRYTQSRYGNGLLKGNILHAAGKLTLDANYSYWYGDLYGEAAHEARHPLGGERVEYRDLTTNKSHRISHSYRAGMDYKFGKGHVLGLAYTGSWSSNLSTNRTTGNSISLQQGKDHAYLHNADLSYSLPFNLQLGASYTRYKNPQNQRLDGTMFGTDRNLTAKSDQQIDKWLFTADQAHSLQKGWGLSYGAKAQLTKNASHQTTQTPEGEILPEATSGMDINERIVNGYFGFSKQAGQTFSLDMSATAEHYHSPLWDQWRIYPTLNATWNADERNMLNLSLGSDAQYPSYWSTMNSVYYPSTYSEIAGNPNLKPYSIYSLSLMWQLDRKYTFMAFADFMPDYIVQQPYQPADRMAVIMKEVNFDRRNSFGLHAAAQFKSGSWLNGNVFAVGLYTNDKCSRFFDLSFNRRKLMAIAGGTASARLCKLTDIRLMLNPRIQTATIQGVYDIRSMFSLNASLRWASNNSKWNISLAGNNLTNRRFNSRSSYANQDFRLKVRQDWTSASLSVIYKLGNYKQKQTKEVDTSRMGH